MPRILMERSGEMEVFARVVQEASFSAAARSLDLTPSAVSKLIARLETRLGVRLLVRTTRALTLTEEGESYYRAALLILQDLNEADRAVSGGAARGRLRINATLPFGRLFIAPQVPPFLKLYPNLTIDLSFTDAIVDLLEQKADIAVRMGTLPDSGLIARKLGESRRVICAAPAYLAEMGIPQTPEALHQHKCLTFNFRRTRPTWPFRRNGLDIEQPVSGPIQVNNGETLRQMALLGSGIARLGLFHVADDLKTGALVPLLESYNPGDLEMITALYVGGGPVPQRVRAFLDHLGQGLAGEPLLHGKRFQM